MATVTYDPRSFYAQTKLTQSYLDVLTAPTIILDGNQKPYVIDNKYDHRPDRLSYDLYSTSKLWWVFAVCNRDILEDPLWDFKTGIEIIVPSPESVRRFS
jgi:hypothetical protein